MLRIDCLANVQSALLLGAHCDDVEIGCGGMLQALIAANPAVSICWVVFSSDDVRSEETRSAVPRLLGDHKVDLRLLEFRNGYLPYVGAEVKDYFEKLKRERAFDLVATHYRDDLHQDHRVVAELAWSTFRDHLILEYEIPKYDGGLNSPSLFVPLTLPQVETKVATLLSCFPSQVQHKRWFTDETFRAVMRLRGIECNAPSGYAEAFYLRKVTVG